MERLHVGAPAVLAELSLGFIVAQVLTMCMKKPPQ